MGHTVGTTDQIGRRGAVGCSDAIGDRVLEHARTLYAGLAEALHDQLFHVRCDAAAAVSESDIAKTSDLVKRHEMALQTVLNLQAKLLPPPRQAADGLDLEAARREIFQRLARLAA